MGTRNRQIARRIFYPSLKSEQAAGRLPRWGISLRNFFCATALASAMVLSMGSVVLAQDAQAELRDLEGGSVGTVTLQSTPHGTLMFARLNGLPEGTHAFHVHAVGKCEPPFKSAGGHFNPEETQHGFLNPAGPHAGDMPNIHVPSSGELNIEVLATGVMVDETLFDDDGASIVIHQGADDYTTDPAGSAGPRIACGVIER